MFMSWSADKIQFIVWKTTGSVYLLTILSKQLQIKALRGNFWVHIWPVPLTGSIILGQKIQPLKSSVFSSIKGDDSGIPTP